MSKQLKLDDFNLLPEYVEDEVNREGGSLDFTPEAKVICGECGAVMKNMGTTTTRYNKDDNILGSWMFSCRVHQDGTVVVVVKEDGTIDHYHENGSGHQIIEVSDDSLEVAVGDNEEGTPSFVYPDEEYKDPQLWEEP